MESLKLGGMDEFFLKDTMYGESDSEEEIVCTSCSRGRLRQSVLMPRLPHYRIVHQKKLDSRIEQGLAENGIKQRVLGRGRAKCKEITVPPPPGKIHVVDSAAESSSADERIKHVVTPKCSVKWKKELRKPKTKPKILNLEFPQLVAAEETKNSPDKEENLDNNANFQDMAKFLMESWQDEVNSCGQFDDVSSEQDYDDSKMVETKGDHSNSDKNELNSDLEKQTEDYINKLKQEVDDEDLGDFENIEVSSISNIVQTENSKETNLKKSRTGKTTTLNGIWYSSDEVYNSNTGSTKGIDSDFSDDTDLSMSTESLLSYDQCNNDNMNRTKSNYINGEHFRNFDLTLPSSINNSQGNEYDNTVSTSEPSHKYSTLSSSKTESESKRSSFTTDKDDSIEDDWMTLSRKEKRKKRDSTRASNWHEKYPGKGSKQSTDTDSENKKNVKKVLSSQTTNNTQQKQDVSNLSWRLMGESVIQINGLPVDCDIAVLQDLIASYGTVKDFEKQTGTHSSSVRFRLNDIDACEMVVSCLDDTDIFPDATNRITCTLVQ